MAGPERPRGAPEAGRRRRLQDRRLAAFDALLEAMRRRALQSEEHAAELAPNVLDSQAELVLDGRRLDRLEEL
jgi:hypothetical protein